MLRRTPTLLLLLAGACATGPERPDDFFARGVAARARGDVEVARHAFRDAVRANPRHFRAHVERQDLLLEASDYPRLQLEYDRLHDDRDGDRMSTVLLARIAADPAERRDRLEAFVAGGPADRYAAQAHRDLARLALDGGRPQAAVAHADRALAIEARHAATVLVRALALEQTGATERAFAAFGAARAAGADAAAAAAGRARVRIAAGDLSAAEAELSSVPEAKRRSATWLATLAELAVAQGEDDAAAVAFQRAYNANPDDRDLRRRYGLWLARTGDEPHELDFAWNLVTGLVDERSTDVELLVAAGRLDLELGRAVSAVRKLDRARALGADVGLDQLRSWWRLGVTSAVARSEIDDVPEAVGLRALARTRVGMHAEAEADFAAALEARPDRADLWAGWADLLLATGREAEVEERLAAAPDHPAVAAARARAWFALGEDARAERVLDDAIAGSGRDGVLALRQRAALDLARRDEAGARRWLDRARARDRRNPVTELAIARLDGPTFDTVKKLERLCERPARPRGALLALVETLLARDEVARARAKADRFASVEPESAETHAARGVTLVAVGRRMEAIRAFGEALRRDPGLREARLGRARLLASAEDPSLRTEAELDYRRAVEIDARDVEARIGLAELLTEDERGAEARAILAPLRASPRPPATALALDGRLAEAAGQTDDAIESLAALLRLRPADAGVHFRLGRLHARRGDEAEALFYLRRSVKLGGDVDRAEPWIRRLREGAR